MQFAVLFLGLFCCFSEVSANTEKLFDPVSIEIEQKGANPSAAKKKALDAALRFAFKDILETQLNCDKKTADSVKNKQIADCLYEYEIENEKFSDSLYIAKISYRFNRDSVETLLKKNGATSINSDSEKKNFKKQAVRKILLRTKDFTDRIACVKDFQYNTENISGKRVIISTDDENLNRMNGVVSYLKL